MAGDFQGWPIPRHAAVWMVESGKYQLWRSMPALKTAGAHFPVNSSVIKHFLLRDGIYKLAP